MSSSKVGAFGNLQRAIAQACKFSKVAAALDEVWRRCCTVTLERVSYNHHILQLRTVNSTTTHGKALSKLGIVVSNARITCIGVMSITQSYTHSLEVVITNPCRVSSPMVEVLANRTHHSTCSRTIARIGNPNKALGYRAGIVVTIAVLTGLVALCVLECVDVIFDTIGIIHYISRRARVVIGLLAYNIRILREPQLITLVIRVIDCLTVPSIIGVVTLIVGALACSFAGVANLVKHSWEGQCCSVGIDRIRPS